ncbi:MAG TPA: carboxypeptidase-like regulatory domain-containing protein, partial [Cyclobacteriaceae bacterium]|nr:carboxypeptidase-like regulatory domain-containing protein [Cyclobacteriaceae bacterium]
MADLGNDIERYLKGEMSPAEMHALEKQALHDPFLADALEGAHNFPDDFTADVRALNHLVSSKTKPGRPSVRWYYQAAAAVLLMGVSAVLIYYLSGREQAITPITMNKQEEPPVQENYTPLADTVAPEENTPYEATPDEPIPEKKKPEPPRPVEEPKVSVQKKTADSSAEAPGAEESEVGTPPSPAEPSPGNDSEQARSFALRREARNEVAGNAAAASEFRINEVRERQTLHGKVTDIDDGLPLPGVNVVAKGSDVGTVTDLNGNFE